MTIRVKQLGTTFVYETGPMVTTPVATGGINGSIQYNNNGVFGGSSNLTFLNSFVNLTGSLLVLGSAYISGSLAQGNTAAADGVNSHAEGFSTNAGGNYSHAEGVSSYAGGGASHAEGYSTVATGDYSHAEGNSSTASANYSHAEGYQTTASANYAHAEGYQTTASGLKSHAEGELNTASGQYSHAEGYQNGATGGGSHAEGYQNLASSGFAHVEGFQNVASGYASHAEGEGTKAKGASAHSEGYQTEAVGNYSHSEGYGTIASGSYQLVVGQFNKRDNSESLFVVGNGTGDANANRADVFRIEPAGRVEVTGSLVVSSGVSGSLTRLSDGTSYLRAGSNVTIVTASAGYVTISSTGGTTGGTPAGSDKEIQFNSAGSFGSSANLSFDYGNNALSLTGSFGMKGNIVPDADVTYTLGTSEKRWGHVYTGDLHLRNDRGDWTIVEERDYLCVVNNITGKKYKMMLQEIKDDQ